MKQLYRLDDGEFHWVVAETEAEAIEAGLKYGVHQDKNDIFICTIVDPDMDISVFYHSAYDKPDCLPYDENDSGRVTVTARRWCEVLNAGDYLCTTSF